MGYGGATCRESVEANARLSADGEGFPETEHADAQLLQTKSRLCILWMRSQPSTNIDAVRQCIHASAARIFADTLKSENAISSQAGVAGRLPAWLSHWCISKLQATRHKISQIGVVAAKLGTTKQQTTPLEL